MEAVALAHIIELELEEQKCENALDSTKVFNSPNKNKNGYPNTNRANNNNNDNSDKRGNDSKKDLPTPICYNCGIKGHMSPDCFIDLLTM